MNRNRRTSLQVAGSAGLYGALLAIGLLRPGQASAQSLEQAFKTTGIAETLKALGAGGAPESKDIVINAPDIAENGAVVPVGCSTTLPGVRRMMILVEKNPSVLAAAFDVTDAVDASFNTRVKMGQSSNVYAVAMMGDGRVLFAGKEIKVTLGGCGG